MRGRALKKPDANTETLIALGPISRTADGLRDALFDEIDLLRAGKTTTVHARALANLVRQILDFARLELQHKKALEAAKSPLKLHD